MIDRPMPKATASPITMSTMSSAVWLLEVTSTTVLSSGPHRATRSYRPVPNEDGNVSRAWKLPWPSAVAVAVTLASASTVTGPPGVHPDPDTPTVPPGATELLLSTSAPASACWLPPGGVLAPGVVGGTETGVGEAAVNAGAGWAGALEADGAVLAGLGAVDGWLAGLWLVGGCVPAGELAAVGGAVVASIGRPGVTFSVQVWLSIGA